MNTQKFIMLIKNEQAILDAKIRNLVQQGMSNQLTHAIRELASKNQALISKLGGQATILHILKNKNTDEHSNIIKECIINSLNHHNNERVIKLALKKCIESQYSEELGWHHIPIRFYRSYRDNTPYLINNALSTGSSSERTDFNQIDASWIWNNKCIYLWHRWSKDETDSQKIQKELEYFENTKDITKSLYGDHHAMIICLVHGHNTNNINIPENTYVLQDPWNINSGMHKILNEKNPVLLHTGFK